MDSPYMTYEMVAEYTTLSQQSLRRAVMRGEVPYAKICKRVVFTKEDIDRWLSEKSKKVR